MYTEVSLVISFGLILILILTHFDFKSKLFDFENELKINKKRNFKKINNLKEKIETKYGELLDPINCEGKWECNTECIKTYVVDKLPRFGGTECPIEPHNQSCSPGQDYCPF